MLEYIGISLILIALFYSVYLAKILTKSLCFCYTQKPTRSLTHEEAQILNDFREDNKI